MIALLALLLIPVNFNTSDDFAPLPPSIARAAPETLIVDEISASGDVVVIAEGVRQTLHLAGVEARDERERSELLAAEIRLLAGESVRMETVAGPANKDAGARAALLYRLPDGLCVNFEIVRQGSARADALPQREMDRALRYYENVARSAQKGVWKTEAPRSAPQQPAAKPSPKTQARADGPATSAPGDTLVYVTKTGKKYHRKDCRHASTGTAISLREAREKYTPCSQCHPPE